MEMEPEVFAYTLARTVLGVLFFFQAWDKIFRLGLENECAEVYLGTRQRHIPDWLAKAVVYITSWTELCGGALLIAGLFTLPVLYVLGIHLLLVTVSFSFLKGLWDMKHVFPRLALLLLLLLLPQEWNCCSAGNWFFCH